MHTLFIRVNDQVRGRQVCLRPRSCNGQSISTWHASRLVKCSTEDPGHLLVSHDPPAYGVGLHMHGVRDTSPVVKHSPVVTGWACTCMGSGRLHLLQVVMLPCMRWACTCLGREGCPNCILWSSCTSIGLAYAWSWECFTTCKS
jgi:hypothetical protein